MCCAFGCTNREGHGIPFHRFPTAAERRKKWITALKREGWEPTKYSRLCAKHFIEGERQAESRSQSFIHRE